MSDAAPTIVVQALMLLHAGQSERVIGWRVDDGTMDIIASKYTVMLNEILSVIQSPHARCWRVSASFDKSTATVVLGLVRR